MKTTQRSSSCGFLTMCFAYVLFHFYFAFTSYLKPKSCRTRMFCKRFSMNSLVKVPPYSILNFQRKMFFTQNWCNITLKLYLTKLKGFQMFTYDSEETFCSDDCRSWPREEKICWGMHAHIPDNVYWGICLFHVVWTNFFFCNSYVVHTEYNFLFSSTEHCAWAIISPKEVCVLTSASMIVYLFFTRSWSAIIELKLFFTRLWSAIIGTKQPKVSQSTSVLCALSEKFTSVSDAMSE
jgi:hypothetical protein